MERVYFLRCPPDPADRCYRCLFASGWLLSLPTLEVKTGNRQTPEQRGVNEEELLFSVQRWEAVWGTRLSGSREQRYFRTDNTDLSAHLHTGAVAALPVSVGTPVRLNFPEGTGNKQVQQDKCICTVSI